MSIDDELHGILQRACPGCSVVRTSPLAGGISARAVVADVLGAAGAVRRVVVRRPDWPTPEERALRVRSEGAALERCSAFGIRAPRPVLVDPDAGALVLDYVEGAPCFAPADLDAVLRAMATELARIHAVPRDARLAPLARRDDSVGQMIAAAPAALDASLDEPRLRAVLGELWPWPRHNADALLHGDYWPGNVLWRDGQLVAVLDWEEAEIGDPLADVAVARLDLLWAFGPEAVHTFTRLYRDQTALDWQSLARWDLIAALRPMSALERWAETYVAPAIGRPDITPAHMREGHRWFVEQALEELAIR